MEYIVSNHARQMMIERELDPYWVAGTVANPDAVENQPDGNRHYFRAIPERAGRVLHVVMNEAGIPAILVTVYFDRNRRGKL